MEKEKFTREEIETELQDTALGDFKPTDFKVIVDYYLNKTNNDNSKNLYKKIIEENGKEFFKKLDEIDSKVNENSEKTEIDTLISFLSLTPLNTDEIITECPILKSIRAIPTIKTVFTPYTDDSEKLFTPLKDYLEKIGIELIGKHIDIDDIQDSYNSLLGFVKAEGLDGNNTIIDSTSGLRMFGMALYKVAVERGLNLITWRDYQLPLYEKTEENLYIKSENKNIRIPFLAKLVVIPEPKFENNKIRRALNEELKSFNLSGAKSYYNTLGIVDLKKLCQKLERVFNLENILELNSKNFYQSLETTLENILSMDLEEEKNRETIKMILLKLLPIVDYSKILDKINGFNLKKENIDDYIITDSSKDKNLKEKIYYSFILKYLMTKLGEDKINNFIVENIIKKVSKFNKNKKKFKSLEDVFDYLFIDKDLEIKNKLEDISSVLDNLVDEGEPPITLDKNILKILKYNLTIDLLEKEKEKIAELEKEEIKAPKNKEKKKFLFTSGSKNDYKIKHDSIAIPIVKLLKNEFSDDLDEDKLMDIYKVADGTFNKNKSKIKNTINFINEVVNNEIKKLGEKERDFIKIEYKKRDKKISRIFIDDFFKFF